MRPREVGFDDVHGRRLYCLHLTAPTDPLSLNLPSRHFLCLVAADFRGITDDKLTGLFESLCRAGAVYFVCWGPDCERAHDLADQVRESLHPDAIDDSVLMTTSHADESLSEALFFLLCAAHPDDAYEGSTRAALAMTIGDSSLADQVAAALQNPREFIARCCDGDEGAA